MEEPAGSAWLDPTLDACCQRDLESQARQTALQRTLQRFDVVAERERRRKHAVQLSSSSNLGCRCLYNPRMDGGEYPALTELRAVLVKRENDHEAANDDNPSRTKEQSPQVQEEMRNKENMQSDINGNHEDSDDEFDYLLDEELPSEQAQAVQSWQETRLMEMEALILRQEVEEFHGYGNHRQFHPQRIASVIGFIRTGRVSATPPPLVVLHLYDSESLASAWLDVYLEKFAAKARGTLFLRSHGRGTLFQKDAAPLQAKLKAHTDIPALLLIKEGEVVTVCADLQGLSIPSPEEGQPLIDEAALESWLFQSGALDQPNPPNFENLCRMRPEEEALMDSLRMAANTAEPEESYYDCGLKGCRKSFVHEHVGIATEQQDGLVVSVDTVVGKDITTP